MTAPPPASPLPPHHAAALLRHFADLREGTHGGAATTREAKEELFAEAAALLDPPARQALGEIDAHLLLGTGDLVATGVRQTPDGVEARWTLTWPEQREADVPPLALLAHYGTAFHHPHLRGVTVGEWPLNVFTAEQAAAELPTLRAIVAADLHNLVFRRDYRIVPASR
ncbi:hypothetical protein [Streptomyces sp. MP131-18]|uniref:hypothetical protein n=1 Tax=Streptomyces sp. MP131-18 TaxID=1857892 RepID=UPI00097C98DD|nr:hypothetical protein [Streptomyces sp. MP131-18]ONK13537.1 hypothetical protein STBA_43070 [Streptomyces sp. MP131-18]